MTTTSSQVRANLQPLSSSLQDEIYVLNDHTFKKTTWNGISVIQDMASGYYNFVSACKENHKRFNNWRRNKRTERYLRIVHEIYGLEIEFTGARIRAPAEHKELTQFLMYQYVIDGNDLKAYGFLQGYYLNPNIFHSACEWIDDIYAAKVAYLLNLINKRNRLLNQTLEQTIHQHEEEIAKLKQENSQLEDQLLEQTLDKEFLSYDVSKLQVQIHDLNTPINQSIQPSSIYASPVGQNHFQLRFSKETISDSSNIRNLKHIEMVNARDVLDLTRKELKKSNETSKLNGKVVLPTSKLNQTFDLIDEIKQGKIKLPTQEEINSFIDRAISDLKLKRLTPQVKGKIFELEQLKQGNYIPWRLLPKTILERANEQSRDCDIDGLKFNENSIEELVQIKHHNKLSYLNFNEIKTFMNKCNQERYKNIKKTLILHGCKLGKNLKAKIHEAGIDVELV